MISSNGIRLIKSFEGFSPTVYPDSAGLPTVGIGHLIKTGEFFPDPITEAEAETILQRDLSRTIQAVSRLIRSPLNQNQRDSLISWTFNNGGGSLQGSTLRMVLNREEYDEAPDQMRRWVYAGGRKLRGLVIRREIEARLFAS